MEWKTVVKGITVLAFVGGLLTGSITLYSGLAKAQEVKDTEKRVIEKVKSDDEKTKLENDFIHQKLLEKMDRMDRNTSSAIIDLSIEQKESALQNIKLKEDTGNKLSTYEKQRMEQLGRSLERLYKKQEKLEIRKGDN